MRRLGLLALAVMLLLPAGAQGNVTATTELSSEGVALTILGDEANDRVMVTCGEDRLAKVNGLDPVDPALCSEITSLTVDGGPGDDTLALRKVTPHLGFTEPRLCGPCADGSYSIVVECIAGAGSDTVRTSRVGTLVGGCQGMRSMPGDDLVYGSSGRDAIAAGSGKDTVRGAAGSDQLFGGPDDDFVMGGPGNDVIAGKQGLDLLAGESGDDRIAGGPGEDRIAGGSGRDICVGGPERALIVSCEVIRGAADRIALGFAPRS